MEAAVVRRAPACLCVLCGLPAAGKSTLSRSLRSAAAQRGWRCAVVQYDELISERAFQPRRVEGGDQGPDMHTEWKLHRQAVLQCIEEYLRKPGALAEAPRSCQINMAAWERCIQALPSSPAGDSQADQAPLLFLLDDNFYYPSMRYEVFQLARKYSLGFCQAYLQCDLESCISRNRIRPEPVPAEIILEMAKRLEPPSAQKNSWETNSISLNTTDDVSRCDIQRLMDLISSALREPLSPAEDNTEQKEADRQKCAASVVHQADQACRRLISEAMKTARETRVLPERLRSLAAQLNESKAKFLHDLRKQLLDEEAFTQEENIDVELVVKRAVDVFDHNKEEILLRTITSHS